MDTFASILADAKESQIETAKLYLMMKAGGTVEPPMTREDALTILRANIVRTQRIIDRLGKRDD